MGRYGISGRINSLLWGIFFLCHPLAAENLNLDNLYGLRTRSGEVEAAFAIHAIEKDFAEGSGFGLRPLSSRTEILKLVSVVTELKDRVQSGKLPAAILFPLLERFGDQVKSHKSFEDWQLEIENPGRPDLFKNVDRLKLYNAIEAANMACVRRAADLQDYVRFLSTGKFRANATGKSNPFLDDNGRVTVEGKGRLDGTSLESLIPQLYATKRAELLARMRKENRWKTRPAEDAVVVAEVDAELPWYFRRWLNDFAPSLREALSRSDRRGRLNSLDDAARAKLPNFIALLAQFPAAGESEAIENATAVDLLERLYYRGFPRTSPQFLRFICKRMTKAVGSKIWATLGVPSS